MKLLPLFLLLCGTVHAQDLLVSESILQQLTRISAKLPANITEAYQQGNTIKLQDDSLQQMINAAFPALADKMKRRSARLNAMVGYNDEKAILSIIPFNQQFADFFRGQWNKLDALEKEISSRVKPFYGKEVYKTQGYVPAWDSVYQLRRPALIRYRDGVLKLAQADIAYMKANQKMFRSSNESERMEFVEQELSIIQKLVLLKEHLKRIIITDGVEKVEFCQTHSQACNP